MPSSLIVDGYNVLNAWPEMRRLIRTAGLAGARAELIRYLSAYQEYTGVEVTLVFDGRKKGATGLENTSGDEPIKVVYSKQGETADTYIERLVYQNDEPGAIQVATSDRQLKLIVLGMGARQIPSRGLENEVLTAIEEFEQEHIVKSGYGQKLEERIDFHSLPRFLEEKEQPGEKKTSASSSPQPYDLSSICGSKAEDIDLNMLDSYLQKVYNRSMDKFDISLIDILKNLKILTDYKPDAVSTAAGLLCFGKNPQKYLPQAVISMICYAEEEVIDQIEIKGTLSDQIEKGVSFIKGNSRFSISDFRWYPEEVLKEILTNAVAHRDYSMTDSSIKVLLFDDRLEFYSPGILQGKMKVEEVINHRFLRNPTITNFLFLQGFMTRLGLGIANIKRELKEQGYQEPELFQTETEFAIRLSLQLL